MNVMIKNNFDVAESVSEGHPDKICDQISDKILDECLKQDRNSRVACETFITREFVLIGGEITSNAVLNYEKIVRDVLFNIGYLNQKIGIGYNTCQIKVLIQKQSIELKKAISLKKQKICAGDQTIVVGFATNENNAYMPTAIFLANEIMKYASFLRKKKLLKYARPDMKVQIIMNCKKIENILISVQHDKEVNKKEFENFIYKNILLTTVKKYGFNTDFNFLINPSGSFVCGGPSADTGLTGRKLMCDSYGVACSHGGGSFSGKDATKLDRSGAYYARYIAKNLVSAGVADKIEVKIVYIIGYPEPKKIFFKAFNQHYDDSVIESIICKFFDASVENIIKTFSLDKPTFNYFDVSKYGHFGRLELDLPWEKTDKAKAINKEIKEKYN
ncbi:MAG: methionine adenosyltransferase [Bacilli bacterium]|nr:methionine adenosyltransferase [Bacilli bacterium]